MVQCLQVITWINVDQTSHIPMVRLWQIPCHFAGKNLEYMLYEICCIGIHISMKFVLKGPVADKLVMVQIMA